MKKLHQVVGVLLGCGLLAAAVPISAHAAESAGESRSHGAAGVAPASHVVLSSQFQPIRAGVEEAFGGGDYLLSDLCCGGPLTNGGVSFPHTPAVINERTGTTTALDPGCEADGLGPPWVLMECPQTSGPSGSYDVELYSLTDGTQQMVTPSPGVPPYCFGSSPGGGVETPCVLPAAVGSSWIMWDASCYHCGDTAYFQNIQTGEVRGDPTNQKTYADLNSPTLAQTTCPGVELRPEGVGPPYFGWGSLNAYGQFALAIGNYGVGIGAFLEQCGTHMRRLLTSGFNFGPAYGTALVVSNASTIVWTTSNQLNGLFLPSLQTFTIPLPSTIQLAQGSPHILALTSSGLYLHELGGTLWRTASPTVLPLNVSGPKVIRSGSMLTCVRGSWHNARQFAYEWRVNRTTEQHAKRRLTLNKSRKRRTVSCSVTASNAMGTTTGSSAPLHLR